jgi:MFS family permease
MTSGRPPLHAWLFVAIGFATLAVSVTARSAFSLTMPEWERELGWTRLLGSSAGALVLVAMAVGAPITGILVDRRGPRGFLACGLGLVAAALGVLSIMREPWQLVAGFVVVGGIGFSMAAMHVVSTGVAARFTARRGLAIGIATAGATVGQLVLMPIVGLISAEAGWRASLAALGILALVLAPAAHLLLRDGPRERVAARHAEAAGGAHFAAVLRDPVFHALFWSFVVCGFTTSGVIEVHLLPYAAACGFPPQQSAFAYGILSAFNLAGMVAAGHLADRMHRPLLLGGIYILRGLSFLILMGIADDYALLIVFAVIFGLFDYATVPVVGSLVASHLGLRVMGLTMGALFAGHSLGAAAGAFLGGVLYELYARYLWVWAAALVLAVGAGFIVFTIRERRPAPAPA